MNTTTDTPLRAKYSLKVRDLIANIDNTPDHISESFVTFPTEDVRDDGTILYGHNCFSFEEGRWEGFWSAD